MRFRGCLLVAGVHMNIVKSSLPLIRRSGSPASTPRTAPELSLERPRRSRVFAPCDRTGPSAARTRSTARRVHPVPVALELPDHLPVARVPDEDGRVPARRVQEPVPPPLHARHCVRVRRERHLAVSVRRVPTRAPCRRPRRTPGRFGGCRTCAGSHAMAVTCFLCPRIGPPSASPSRGSTGARLCPWSRRRSIRPSGLRDAEDPVGVPRQGRLGRLRLVVPQAHGGVPAPAREVLAVGEN